MMDIRNSPVTMVIFGATGDLYLDKLAKALFIRCTEQKLPNDFKIIAFARKDFSNKAFRSLTKESILKKGSINNSKLDEFLEHVEYFCGDFLRKSDFIKLYDILSLRKDRSILFHIATPVSLYREIFQHIKDSNLHAINQKTKILIEKPFGENESDAKLLDKLLSGIFKEENIFRIDHYLAKVPAGRMFDFRFNDGSLENKWSSEYIDTIKVIFHESNVVGSRGASYDKVGAFRDVGENHMLELLAILLMQKPSKFDAKNIRESRTKALAHLYIDYNYAIVKGQYEGYQNEPGVVPHSMTETFFRFFLKSKDSRFLNIPLEFEGGKGLVDMHSNITSTTVSLCVSFKNGEVKEFKIQPVEGTQYNSYTKVYMDAIAGDQTLFVSMEEIIVEWRLADELLSKWKDIPLIRYKKGSRAGDIK